MHPRGAPADAFTTIAEGTLAVTDAVLGQLDPSLLLNGQYDLVLTAEDASGNVSSVSRTVLIDEDLKVGHFAFTVEDLTVPVVGIPVTVTRTYDTRRKDESLDFGHGWSIDYQNVRVQENRVLGKGWSLTQSGGTIKTYCLEPAGPHVVSVRLPDGELAKFDMTVSPRCQQVTPPTQVTPVFTPRPGTNATLTSEDVGNLTVNGDVLLDGGSAAPFDVAGYTLTTAEGFAYELEQGFGIRRITDPNGNGFKRVGSSGSDRLVQAGLTDGTH